MGKGDKKTEKGKRFKGSFGNSRPQKIAKESSLKNSNPENPTKKTTKKASKKS